MAKTTWLDSVREMFGLAPKKSRKDKKKLKAQSTRQQTSQKPHSLSSSTSISTNTPTTNKTSQTTTRRETKPNRINWVETKNQVNQKKPPPIRIKDEPRIDWGSSTKGGAIDLEAMVGVEDAFDHTQLLPGEKVAVCKRDRVAYHYSTWQFLQSENQGRCCICGLANVFTFVILPGVAREPVIAPIHPRVTPLPGETIINLQNVHNYVGRAVIVQDYVYEVYCTKATGTYFVRFEPRDWNDAPFEGFKVVIFPSYAREWQSTGLSIGDYSGKYIRVRGIIQVHPTWGIEILVNSPRVIEIVEGPKHGK